MTDHSTISRLKRALTSLDGKSYGAYKSLKGTYDLGHATLSIDRVQSDPYAPPSLMQLFIDRDVAEIPEELLSDYTGQVAVGDFLMREFARATRNGATHNNAHNSAISIGRPSQLVLERTNVVFTPTQMEVRFSVHLPAAGRRIRGFEAAKILTELLPQVISQSLLYRNLDHNQLAEHVQLLRDQEDLRGQLTERKLVAFVGNGAILPRKSGDSDESLKDNAIPFTSPPSLETTFTLPSGRTITGMGIPEGITVIVGGGYHGKSTLLRAIEHGVYPHIGSDGRQWVITRADATAIRAEDGRAVTGVDISPFINNLPSGANTRSFFTTNASGSTSQATNLVEAVEAGASALLIDEDTSATNFMIRDRRMQQLIPAKDEPITPFVQRVRPLLEEKGVSTILVAGGSGAFFDVADHVIAMNSYVPTDVTQAARALAEPTLAEPQADLQRTAASISAFSSPAPRVPQPSSPPPKPAKAAGTHEIRYGKDTVDLAALTQLIDAAQTAGVAHGFDLLLELADGKRTLTELGEHITAEIERYGLEALSPHRGHPGLYARPRIQEILAAVNRYRKLQL